MAAFTSIAKPSSHFDIVQYTGNGTMPREIDGLNFKPDMLLFCVKIMAVLTTVFLIVQEVVIKLCNLIETILIITAAVSDHGIISSFDSDGFTVNNGSSGSYPKLQVNDNSPFGVSANILHTVGKTEMVEQQLQTMMVMFQLLYKQIPRRYEYRNIHRNRNDRKNIGMV